METKMNTFFFCILFLLRVLRTTSFEANENYTSDGFKSLVALVPTGTLRNLLMSNASKRVKLNGESFYSTGIWSELLPAQGMAKVFVHSLRGRMS